MTDTNVARTDGMAYAGTARGSYMKFMSTLWADQDGHRLEALKKDIEACMDKGTLSYALIGPHEIAEETDATVHVGQHHHHVLLHAPRRIGFPALKKLLTHSGAVQADRGGMWDQAQQHNTEKSRAYCLKSTAYTKGDASTYQPLRDPVLELGVPVDKGNQGGKRSDVERLVDDIETGVVSCWDDCLRLHINYSARPNAKNYVNERLRMLRDNVCGLEEGYQIMPWQFDMVRHLLTPTDDRKIIFVIDHEGNSGKSWLAKHLQALLGHFGGPECDRNVNLLRPGRVQDVASTIDVTANVFVMDVPRSSMEFLQYRILEEIKDRYVAAHKYDSSILQLRSNHLVVLSNEAPDYTKLSRDRYFVVRINAEDKVLMDPPPPPNFGSEFSSDMTGDGPTDMYARPMLSDVVEGTVTVSDNSSDSAEAGAAVPTKFERVVPPQPCISSLFFDRNTNMHTSSYLLDGAHRQTFHCSSSVNNAVCEMVEYHLEDHGHPVRVDGVQVDLAQWPTWQDCWDVGFDMSTGYTHGNDHVETELPYCDIDGVWWHIYEYTTRSRSPVGSNRMCFSYAHALSQEAGGYPSDETTLYRKVINARTAIQRGYHFERALLHVPLPNWVRRVTLFESDSSECSPKQLGSFFNPDTVRIGAFKVVRVGSNIYDDV